MHLAECYIFPNLPTYGKLRHSGSQTAEINAMLKPRPLHKHEDLPYHLLLLADETIEAIEQYVHQSEVYMAEIEGEPMGVVCLYPVDARTVEIKKLAIAERYQGRGYGTLLMDGIKERVKKDHATMIVGTADAGRRQIAFYEKNGFRKFGLKKNFFIDHYKAPIYEDGVQLRDMVMLKLEL